MTLKEILEFNLLPIGDFKLSVYHLIAALLVLMVAKVVMMLTRRILKEYFRTKHIDTGRRYAIEQFLKYIIYTIAILMALQAIGINLSLLWGGAAALLVGIGLGLQQTFNDLISGIILLMEGSVEVGDIMEVDGVVGKVERIGIRTSNVETRDQISILIPNSKLIGDKTINWSHNQLPSRFNIPVGVSYSSDIELVTNLLYKALEKHPKILTEPKPSVHFADFGNSSLDFILQFYSRELMGIELVKSQIRYKIMSLFREHHVEIPFPQRDLWLKNAEVLRNPHEDESKGQ